MDWIEVLSSRNCVYEFTGVATILMREHQCNACGLLAIGFEISGSPFTIYLIQLPK
jgi:hypothetical protein